MTAQTPNISADDPDLGRKIEVLPYDPAWPRQFDEQAARLRALLGDAVLAIDHVGSTAVPGLAAKPVIDIHLTAPNSADEPAYAPVLEGAGYRLLVREPGWFEHRMFKGRDPEVNLEVNLHVFSAGCPEPGRCRMFRDWLRNSPQDVARYASVKQALAQRRWEHVQDYANAKQDVIAEIMSRAEAWDNSGRPSAAAPSSNR